MRRGAGLGPAPEFDSRERLAVDDGDDLEGARIDHDDLVAHDDEIIAAPFRVDGHDIGRKRMEGDIVRYAGANRDVEIDVGHRRDVLVPDHGVDFRALLGRELRAGAGLANGLGHVLGTLLSIHGAATVPAALGFHIVLVFATFGLLAVLVLTAFGFHVLAAALALV